MNRAYVDTNVFLNVWNEENDPKSGKEHHYNLIIKNSAASELTFLLIRGSALVSGRYL